jgi:hypothetical protein
MATPFFRGNYGSALSQVDTRPIIEAGRATGQMYANMGAQVGGMIKEYGLNKEKQKKQKANIKSTVNFLDSLTKNDPEMEDQYASMKEQLLNEDISLTERDTLASQGLKQVSLSSQLESQRLNQDTARLANEFAEETRNVRSDMLGQQRDFQEFRNKVQALDLDKIEQLQPKEISAKLAEFQSILDTMPSRTKATISQAEGVVGEERARQAREDLLGGPEGVAAQQLTAEESALAGTDARTDYTKALRERMKFLSRPVDTSIPGNVDIAKEIKAISSDIASLESEETRVKDPNDEDKYLKIKDFFIYDDYEQKYVVNEELKKKLSPRLEVQFDALRLAYDKQTQLRMNELVPIDLKQKDGSSKTEFVPRREYLRLLKLKEDAEAAAADAAEKQRDANIRKNTIFGRTDNRLMGQPKF